MLSRRLAKWMLLLSEYTITYEPVKAVKGQVVADFLAAHPVTESEIISDDFPDEQVMLVKSQSLWQMYFDVASRASGASAGVIFITPQGDLLPYSFTLGAACTNNEAKDSKLIINQLKTEFEIRKQELLPYYQKAQQLLEQFYHVEIKHVPRAENAKADALASLAAAQSCPNRSPL
ncbi:uncharacterized protein LOC131228787 [Magnolia sinica]|uniref:uncharacterized protein LOC131228787 n=1 Tax=Magnolia sinica TaxID=86752 RepID=UPI00265ABE74|nr:uncharacterized protein LOC131228787 [Magnolia sinica]